MKYPDNYKTKKARATYWLFKRLYIFEQGKGSVLGRFTGWFQEVGILILLLRSYNKEPPIWLLIIIFVVVIQLCYILGHYYLKYNCDRINNQVSMERQPLMNAMYEKIVKKREQL